MADLSDSVVSNNVNTAKELSAVQNKEAPSENKTDKVMEPLLVEDFSFLQQPQTVRNVLAFLEKNKQASSLDILVGLIYVLYLESGFESIEDISDEEFKDRGFNIKKIQESSKKLPKDWKTDTTYNLTFVLPPYYDLHTKVTCFLLADDLIVNCVVSDIENAQYTECLDPLLYFLDSNMHRALKHLQNLKHLSSICKQMAYNAKQKILRAKGELHLCLEALPTELVVEISSYLNVEDLVSFGRVNSFCEEVLTSSKIWLHLLQKDFSHTAVPEERMTWKNLKYPALKEIYVNWYVKTKRAQKRERSFSGLLQLHFIPEAGYGFGLDVASYYEYLNSINGL